MKTTHSWVRTLAIALVVGATALFVSIGSAHPALSVDTPGEGITVQSGVASWTSAIPVAAVYEALLETLGYEVEETEFASNPIFYQAVNQGDVDYWPNGWFPLHNPQLPDDFDQNATIFEAHCPACGLQGYLVNSSAIDEFGITSLQDFADPEIKAAFDSDGDGRADLFGCPPGWGCHDVINFHLQALGLEEHINHATASYSANFANATARVGANENALYYTWTPNFTVLELVPGQDVTWINVVDDAADLVLAPSQEGFDPSALIGNGVEGAVSDPINLGFVAADIDVVANNEFLANNPAAESIFQDVRLPLSWISQADARIGEGEDAADVAQEYLNDPANAELVATWLANARQAAAQ